MKLNEGFPLVATAPDGIARLRELILSLAVQGKLVPRDPNDEASDTLLNRIAEEKTRLDTPRKIGRDKPLRRIDDDEKPFVLPEKWRWIRLGSAIELISGQHLGPSEYVDGLGSDIPYLTGPAEFGPCNPEPTRSTVVRRAVAIRDDILITVKGSGVGKLNIVSQAEIAISRQLMAIRPILLNAHFVQLVLRAMGAVFQQKAVGIAIPGLSREDVTEAVIGLPPIAEQARIVAKVDELMHLCDELDVRGRQEAEQHARLTATLFDALAASESAPALAENWARIAAHFDLLLDRPEAVDVLEQTILQLAVRGRLVSQDSNEESASELLARIRAEKNRLIAEGTVRREKPLPAITEDEQPFGLPSGWKWVRWNEVAKQIGDIDHKMPNEVADGIPYVSPKDFLPDNGIDFENAKKISPADFNELSLKIRPASGDLIYPRYGTIGKVRLVRTDRPFLASYSCAIIKALDSHVVPEFQYYVSISPLIADQAKSATNKTTQPNVGLKSIQAYAFPLPPLPEQKRIVARVDELLGLCANLRVRLTEREVSQARFAEAMVEQTARDLSVDQTEAALAA